MLPKPEFLPYRTAWFCFFLNADKTKSSRLQTVEKGRYRFDNCFQSKYWKNESLFIFAIHKKRDVAQPGSAHVWGAWGRKFKSCHPDF